MIQFLIDGGPVMIPIGASSVVALAAFFERLWALRRGRVAPRAVVQKVLEHSRSGQFTEARAACAASDSAVARLLEVAVDWRGGLRSEVKERIEEVGEREAAELERWVWVLGTIGALGPLLGLLGTVGGMIVTFNSVRDTGSNGSVEEIAGGIAQALVCTFAGLTVAIPSLIAHRYLQSKIDLLVGELQEASLLLLDVVALDAKKSKPAAEAT